MKCQGLYCPLSPIRIQLPEEGTRQGGEATPHPRPFLQTGTAHAAAHGWNACSSPSSSHAHAFQWGPSPFAPRRDSHQPCQVPAGETRVKDGQVRPSGIGHRPARGDAGRSRVLGRRSRAARLNVLPGGSLCHLGHLLPFRWHRLAAPVRSVCPWWPLY